MSDNPYRFTVEVKQSTMFVGKTVAVIRVVDADRDVNLAAWPFSTEAEANEHAELIRQAMREVSR